MEKARNFAYTHKGSLEKLIAENKPSNIKARRLGKLLSNHKGIETNTVSIYTNEFFGC